MWLMMLNAAYATELVFALSTGEGIQEQWTKDHKEALTQEFGPVAGRGKRVVRYNVTVMPSVFDPMENGFQTQVTICRSWRKGTDRDRDCVEQRLLIPAKADGPVNLGGKVKATDKFQLDLNMFYDGQPPMAVGLPGDEPPVVEEPEPVEAPDAPPEPEVPPEPEKDEMASALEDIVSGIVDDLGDQAEAEPAEPEPAADEAPAPADDAADGDKKKAKKKKKKKGEE